jgi:hypothetical protein
LILPPDYFGKERQMTKETILLRLILVVTLLCGCGGSTGTFTEQGAETESSEPEPAREVTPPDVRVDPDRLAASQPKPEQARPEDVSAPTPESKTGAPQKQSEGDQQHVASLSQARKDLDTTMSELKTAIFEDRNPFVAMSIASRLADIFTRVGIADSQDPKLYDIIKKVKENYDKVREYLEGEQISGAQKFFTEMEKYYQEWKAQMK